MKAKARKHQQCHPYTVTEPGCHTSLLSDVVNFDCIPAFMMDGAACCEERFSVCPPLAAELQRYLKLTSEHNEE